MSTELKEKINIKNNKRDISPKSVFRTMKNSINGIIYYAKDGKSIVLYIMGLIAEITLGLLLKISGLEWIIIVCMMTVILAVELLNTAIEAACDAITKEYNPYIKIAKDCASGATFSVFVVIVVLSLIIFIPKVIALF